VNGGASIADALYASLGFGMSSQAHAVVFSDKNLDAGALNFVFTWCVRFLKSDTYRLTKARPAVFTIDTYGRRTLNLFFFPLMAISLFAAGVFDHHVWKNDYVDVQTNRHGLLHQN